MRDGRPVRRSAGWAWLGWLRTQGITSGPVFRQLSTGHNLTARALGPKARLSAAAIGERIQALATQADIDKPATITSQGQRAGAATDLAAARVRGRQLARAGRWREDSPIPERVYVRPTEQAGVDPFASVPAAASSGDSAALPVATRETGS